MYKLYNVKAWGSMCVHFLLEDMGVPYQNIWMTEEQVRAPDFRAISPLGQIPALGLQDGRSLFESAAIMTFLLSAHPDKGLSPLPGSDDYGEFLSWLNFMSTNVYPDVSFAFYGHPYSMNAEQDAFTVMKATEKLDELFLILDKRLKSEGPWLMGENYSALDIYCFMLTIWGRPSEAALHRKFPHLVRLAQAVRARPKLKAALEAHGVMDVGGYGS